MFCDPNSNLELSCLGQASSTVHYSGIYIPAVGPSLNGQWGKKIYAFVANAGSGQGSLVGSSSALCLLDVKRIIFLAIRSNSFVASSSLLHWVGLGNVLNKGD